MLDNDKPYEAVDIIAKTENGKIVQYFAAVAVGPYMRQKIAWVTNNRSPESVKKRLTKWAQNERVVLLAEYAVAMERSAQIRREQAAEAEAARIDAMHASAKRIAERTAGIRNAVKTYGKGFGGYWRGYVNVYGKITDGDV